MLRSMEVLIRLAVFLMLAALMGACGAASQGSAPSTTAPAEPVAAPTKAPSHPAPEAKTIKRGGIMTYYATSSFAGADPAMGQNAYQGWQINGTYMLRRTPEDWTLEGDAIEKWEVSPDGMEITLHVRKGMKWQNKPPVNGREVEARDIVYTLRSIVGLQYPDMPPLRFPRKANLDDMDDAVAVDKYTVKVTMKYPSSTFLDGLSEYRSPITPDGIREYFGGKDSLARPTPETYLSAGPFVLTKFQDTVEAIYERYPDYWEKGVDGQSKPYIDKVRTVWIPNTGTQIAAFVAGQISYISLANPETRKQITDSRDDVQMITYEPQSCWYRLALNLTRKPFDDARVRRAIALVLDPVETGQALWGELNNKPLWRYPGNLPYVFPEAFSQEEMSKLQPYEHPKSQKTIDEARRLMAEAGYADGFSFEMISSTGTVAEAAQLVSSQINRVFPNIEITLKPMDNAIQLERAAKRDFDAQQYCYIHEPTAVAMMKTAYHSTGGRNTPGLADPKMDDLLDRAGRELDPAKRKELLRQAQTYSYEVNSIFGVTHYVALQGLQPQVRNMRLGSGTHYHLYLKDLWLDE